MDFAAVSILKLLPANQLNIAPFSHYHPHGASNVARFSYAQNAENLIFESDQARNLLKLLRRKAKRTLNIGQIVERNIIGSSIDCVRTASHL